MGVYVDKEFRVKRKSSEAGRKSAFAHKVKNGGKNYQRNVQERINRKGASKGCCQNLRRCDYPAGSSKQY